jgi:hypothetical protein
MDANYVALDTEPYGNSPLTPYFKGANLKILNSQQLTALKNAVSGAIKQAGKVDFILPGGEMSDAYRPLPHPYNIIAELGNMRISEETYYDAPRFINGIQYPYEIFGMHLDTTKKNTKSPEQAYFLPNEIFERSQLWSNKKGVFLYTSSSRSNDVALQLLMYAKKLPAK